MFCTLMVFSYISLTDSGKVLHPELLLGKFVRDCGSLVETCIVIISESLDE